MLTDNAREWLEQQEVAGVLVVDAGGGEEGRRYSLPRGHAEVLLDADSTSFSCPGRPGGGFTGSSNRTRSAPS